MGWNKASWANLVDKEEYRKYIRVTNLAAGSLVFSVLSKALADAADDTGLLHGLELPAFYTTHVAKVVCTPDAEHPGFRALTYDAFVATALLENLRRLLMAGLLAQSADPNTYDYHLALPAPAGDNIAAGQAALGRPVPLGTSGGVELTDTVVERLATEAEQGYEPR